VQSKFIEAMPDEETLRFFLASMQKLENAFCEVMHSGCDYTIRLEIHGNNSKVIHIRVQGDDFKRPSNPEKRISGKR